MKTVGAWKSIVNSCLYEQDCRKLGIALVPYAHRQGDFLGAEGALDLSASPSYPSPLIHTHNHFRITDHGRSHGADDTTGSSIVVSTPVKHTVFR